MAILDSIREGLASLESGMKDTASKATNTSGLRGSAVRKEKMKDWSRSKEGAALIDVALSIGLKGIDSVGKSADTAEAFILDSYEKKDELMDLGRKIVDKKSYEAGEKALDLQYAVESFVEENSKSFEKSIRKAAEKIENDGVYSMLAGERLSSIGERGDKAIIDAVKGAGTAVGDALGLTDTPFEKLVKGAKGLARSEKTDSAAARGRGANSKVEEKSFMDVLTEAKESSMKFTSKLVKEVSANAEAFKKELSDKHDVKVSAIDLLLEKSAKDVRKVMKDLADLGNKTDEELAAMGLVKIEGYTRKNGGKVPTHYRKRVK
jgi:hypothetical protein